MTKEPFDIEKGAKSIVNNYADLMLPAEEKWNELEGMILAFARRCFSKGREQGLDLAASEVACATHGTEWSDLVDDILSLKAEGGTELKAESSKEVSGKEGI